MEKQVYIALGTLLTAAAMEAVDACPIEGFESNKFDDILGLKEKGLKSVVVCALGFVHENDEYSKLKKVRYNHEEVFLNYK